MSRRGPERGLRHSEQVWQPLRTWLEQQPDRFRVQLATIELPASKMWSFEFFQKYAPAAIQAEPRPGQPAGQFWWAGDAEQVSTYWYAYHSRWIPLELFEGERARRLAATLFEASRRWTVGLHFNKAQAGASADAVECGRADRSRGDARRRLVCQRDRLLRTELAIRVLGRELSAATPDQANLRSTQHVHLPSLCRQ